MISFSQFSFFLWLFSFGQEVFSKLFPLFYPLSHAVTRGFGTVSRSERRSICLGLFRFRRKHANKWQPLIYIKCMDFCSCGRTDSTIILSLLVVHKIMINVLFHPPYLDSAWTFFGLRILTDLLQIFVIPPPPSGLPSPLLLHLPPVSAAVRGQTGVAPRCWDGGGAACNVWQQSQQQRQQQITIAAVQTMTRVRQQQVH